MQLDARHLLFEAMASRGGLSLLDSANTCPGRKDRPLELPVSSSVPSPQHSCHPLPTYERKSFVSFGSAALCSSSLSKTSAPSGRRRSLRRCNSTARRCGLQTAHVRRTWDIVRGVGKCNESCFFEKVKSTPAPIHVLSSRIHKVEGNLTSLRCWKRTCFFPSRAAQRFDWWLTSRHRSHHFDILSLSNAFQQRHAITPCFRTTSSSSQVQMLVRRSVCLCNDYHGRHQRGGALLRHFQCECTSTISLRHPNLLF